MRLSNFGPVLSFLVLTVLCASTTLADTFYVRTSGSDNNSGLSPSEAKRTIQSAVDLCTGPGSTIYVGPGTYRETINIGVSTGTSAVSGTEDAPTQLIADVAGQHTLDSPGEVIVDGQNSKQYGINMKSRAFWTIQGFTFRNQTQYGVYALESGFQALDCTIQVPTEYAIYTTSNSDLSIANCTFERTLSSGSVIRVNPVTSSSTNDVRITGNDLTLKNDLYLISSLHNGNQSGIGWYLGFRSVHGIVISSAIQATLNQVDISNNQISDCYHPIYNYLEKSSKYELTISNNTITGSYYGIYAYSRAASTATMTNNVISTCYSGMFGDRARSRNYTVAGHVEHNITYDMTKYRRSFESRIITEDPKFFDAPAGDFSLSSGSSCIDAGTHIGAPAVDIAGRSRPTDGNNDGVAHVDIGAYEYVNSAPSRVKVVEWREISGHRNMSNP